MITFENLWSKPFQRTMKYKLILKQYHDNLYTAHPDYPHLIKAISKYEEVSQRNNQSLEQK
jgi:RhoGEF domain